MSDLLKNLERARRAQPVLAGLGSVKRRALLLALAKELTLAKAEILRANAEDLKLTKDNPAVGDRLLLTENRLRGLVGGVKAVANLPEVLGKVLETRKPANGLVIKKISVPLGVIGVIYESRPNVTVDLAVLTLKAGNAIILKGGRESYETNKVLVRIVHKVLRRFRLSRDLVYLLNPSENWKKDLFNAQGLVDVLIPRGGEGLIKYVREHSRIPVIETGAGVCHTFVDAEFDPAKAAKIIINAKTQRPSVCNALDTLVIHKKAAKELLLVIGRKLADYKVEIFADPASFAVLKDIYPSLLLRQVTPAHYGREFLSLRMAIKTVQSFEQGLRFVQEKTSHHSEAIISRNRKHVQKFLETIDAAVVYDNVSTRFTDGGEFGMGAEVGISTQKLHARGPMGAEALTAYKWVVSGKTAIRG